MADEHLDVVILGGGTGGYVAAIRAAQLGLQAAVVEKEKMGGTCLHWGCIPTKVILRSAEILHLARNSAEYGVLTGEITLDYSRVAKRREQIVGRLFQGVEQLLRASGVKVFRGKGTILPPSIFAPSGVVSVEMAGGEREMLAPEHIIIATGSRPRQLPGLPFDGERVLSSDHAVMVDRVPESAVVIGAGAIGVEFASAWNDLGARVTLVELADQVLPLEDAEVAGELTAAFSRRGITVLTGAKVHPETYRVEGDQARIEVEKAGGEREILSAGVILVAIGRRGNVDGIGLENNEKIEVGSSFIRVNERMQTGDARTYAIGDVTGRLLLAHTAAHDGIVAAEAIAGRKPHGYALSRVPRIIFSRPEVASLGLTEAQARAAGHAVKVGKFPFRANGKALIIGEAGGFAKVVADAETEDILGVHLVGPQVTDLIGEPALAMLLDATPAEIGLSVHPHPTLVEVLGEAALAVDGRAIHIVHAARAETALQK